MWAYDYFMQTGDRELIGDIFSHLVKTGGYNKRSENKASGLIDWGSCRMGVGRPSYPTGIVDWPSRYGYDLTTTQRTVLSCNAYENYMGIAHMAAAIGRDDVARQFSRYADAIRDNIMQRLWSEEKQAYVDGLYADGTQSANTSQQANMVPLVFGFTDDGKRTVGALKTVEDAGFSTAPMIVRYLIRAYGDYNAEGALLDYLTNTEGHNWAHIIDRGGTFTWEDWRNPNSESHPVSSYAGVMACQDYILGVKLLEPQYARIKVRPVTLGLDYARGIVPTQRGPVGVDWKNGKTFSMTVSIPCNMRADVHVPKGKASGTTIKVDGREVAAEAAGDYLLVKDVGSGKHTFVR
jgi:alpha-L-rhamnosidase